MAAPTSLRSKLNRAITAYLISAEAGTADNTFPQSSTKARSFPNTTVQAAVGIPETEMVANYRTQIRISIKGSATDSVDATNEETARVAFDARIGTVSSALKQTDDEETLRFTATAITAAGRALAIAVDDSDAAIQVAANNADMADFTITQWYDRGFGDGQTDGQGFDWEEILIFEAVACESDVD